MNFKFRRPSNGTTIAMLALFVALTSTAYAASLPKNSVGSKQIKKNAVTGSKIKSSAVASSDVKNDSLTGSDINESTLGTVPSATSAQSAQTAQSAASVGGAVIKQIRYGGATDSAPVVVYQGSGLTLTATCPSGAPALVANTSVSASAIRIGLNTLTNAGVDANEGSISTYSEDDTFNTGDNFNMVSGTNVVASTARDSVQATFTYANATGGVVTGTMLIEDDTNFAGNGGSCHVIGNIVGS